MKPYQKPLSESCPGHSLLEILRPYYHQYTTITLNTTTGNSSVNVDGRVRSDGDVNTGGPFMAAGDGGNNSGMRAFIGFDTK